MVAAILDPVSSSAVMQCVAAIFTPVANILAMIAHVLSAVAHVLASVTNVFTPVPPVFHSIANRSARVLRQRNGRGTSHQSRGDRGHSEIAHWCPPGARIPRAPSWRALLIGRHPPALR
jgi:hypothetical protein